MTITIYHAKFARSVRIIWACEELGLPYEIEQVKINQRGEETPGYELVHPLRKVPAMKDGDVVMFESLAILEYIFARYNVSLSRKPDSDEYPDYLKWFHFGEASLGPYVTMAMGHNLLLPEKLRIPAMSKWGEREAQRCFEVMAEPLSKHEYLLPSGFSGADISCAYMLLLAKFAKIFEGAPQSVIDYFDRIKERPGWQKATSF